MGPCEEYGYNAVGPGWRHLLAALDRLMSYTVNNAVANATKALPQYRDERNKEDAEVKIIQIKEKFGGLRVYFETTGMSVRFTEYILGACSLAETLSMQACEKCGLMNDVTTKSREGVPYSRVLTLCDLCHAERNSLLPDQRFDLGNGNSTI